MNMLLSFICFPCPWHVWRCASGVLLLCFLMVLLLLLLAACCRTTYFAAAGHAQEPRCGAGHQFTGKNQ